MANTGKKGFGRLREYNVTRGQYTGRSKPNVPSDPDYIPPTFDYDYCPIPKSPEPDPEPTTFKLDKTSISLNSARSIVSIGVTVTSGGFTSNTQVTWIRLLFKSSPISGNVVLEVVKNDSAASREAVVNIINNGETKTFTVRQDGNSAPSKPIVIIRPGLAFDGEKFIDLT